MTETTVAAAILAFGSFSFLTQNPKAKRYFNFVVSVLTLFALLQIQAPPLAVVVFAMLSLFHLCEEGVSLKAERKPRLVKKNMGLKAVNALAGLTIFGLTAFFASNSGRGKPLIFLSDQDHYSVLILLLLVFCFFKKESSWNR